MTDLKEKMAAVIKRREEKDAAANAGVKQRSDDANALFRTTFPDAFNEIDAAFREFGRETESQITVPTSAKFVVRHQAHEELKLEFTVKEAKLVASWSSHHEDGISRLEEEVGQGGEGLGQITKQRVVGFIFGQWKRRMEG